MAKLSASPLNFSSIGDIALLYSLVVITPVLGLSKFRTACECPRPNAKAGGNGCAAGSASSAGVSMGRTGGATAAAGCARGSSCL